MKHSRENRNQAFLRAIDLRDGTPNWLLRFCRFSYLNSNKVLNKFLDVEILRSVLM